VTRAGYDGLQVYYGDLHNHCGISYGHGSVEDAYTNARAQLDFASVTAHAHWPDMPTGDPRLAELVAYHEAGFRRAATLWPHLQDVTRAVHEDGRFVTFLSFEWHSLRYGDHNVYYKDARGEIIRAPDLEELRRALRELAARGVSCVMLPHHIGYLTGRRGLRWESFTPEFTPLVEMVSMHGLAESDEGPYAYLHTMGPRDGRSTMQHGLGLGHVFGIIGSSDHHSAHPGSYGTGRLGVWARELTRDGIWEALCARRTYALTGDRIALAVSLNGHPMGAVAPAAPERRIEIRVEGGAAIDYVEVLHRNRPIHRWNGGDLVPAGGRVAPDAPLARPVKVHTEVGWGPRERDVDWSVELEVVDGRLVSVEPRFRGRHVVSPQASAPDEYAFSAWERTGERAVRFRTRTWGNTTTLTPSMQGLCLEIAGDARTRLRARFNDRPTEVALPELLEGARTGYLGGFRTPAWCFHRAVPAHESALEGAVVHAGAGTSRDWYYVRVAQRNGQWAWSSPIWVEAG